MNAASKLLESCDREVKDETLYRLIALPRKAPATILRERGLRMESVAETLNATAVAEAAFSPEEVIRFCFVPRSDSETPFAVGRFGDGSEPVFYSALEEATSIAEVAHHRRDMLESVAKGELIAQPHFHLCACNFAGAVFVLAGHEDAHPDLVSQSESGYPFCREVAGEARATVAALHSPSARKRDGVCVPVFQESTLSSPRTLYRGVFIARDSNVTFEPVDDANPDGQSTQ